MGWITSQNDTAPKQDSVVNDICLSWITSQNDTAPKQVGEVMGCPRVGLPVRTTLLQNPGRSEARTMRLDYQSERHCSKTEDFVKTLKRWLDYQSERHCSKTIPSSSWMKPSVGLPVRTTLLQNQRAILSVVFGLDYQSERHCSKTATCISYPYITLDYQSERHCSKTSAVICIPRYLLDYQSERHCSKTCSSATGPGTRLDYQSERHCSKTHQS